ncbi:hypothetical protein ACFL6I_22255 [candidate division KSB1 bacterium]
MHRNNNTIPVRFLVQKDILSQSKIGEAEETIRCIFGSATEISRDMANMETAREQMQNEMARLGFKVDVNENEMQISDDVRWADPEEFESF